VQRILNGDTTQKPLRIAVLYGAFHIDDLSSKLQGLGFKSLSTSALTAWEVPLLESVGTSQNAIQPAITRILAIATAAVVYLVLSALDWYLLLDLTAEGLRDLFSSRFQASDEAVMRLSVEIVYLIFYIQRHSLLYNRASNVGVQWQRGLFDGI
jgi:hypothetical protein